MLVYVAKPVLSTVRNVVEILKAWMTCSNNLLEIGSGSFPLPSGERFVNALLVLAFILLADSHKDAQYTHIRLCLRENYQRGIYIMVVSQRVYIFKIVKVYICVVFGTERPIVR